MERIGKFLFFPANGRPGVSMAGGFFLRNKRSTGMKNPYRKKHHQKIKDTLDKFVITKAVGP